MSSNHQPNTVRQPMERNFVVRSLQQRRNAGGGLHRRSRGGERQAAKAQLRQHLREAGC